MKKIVIIGSAYPLRGGGLATFNERLARAFTFRKFLTRIETFSLQYPSFLFPGKTQYSDEAAPKDLDITVSVNSINPFSWRNVGRKIKKEKPDLVILRYWIPFISPSLGTIARIIRKNKHTKIVAIADNIIPHEKRIGDALLSKYFVNSVDGFVTMSQTVMDDLDQFDTQKPRLFNPHPLYDNFGDIMDKSDARAKLGLEKDQKYILFFGFIRDYKGLDLLLEAMTDPRMKAENIKLIIAGEFYAGEEKTRQYIKDYQLENSLVLRTDFIPNTEVGLYFNACDIVVQPYKTATQSGVTQIGYHFEKPMLVTHVGGLAEIIHHNKTGYVCQVNPKDIADHIIKFYQENKAKDFAPFIKEEKKKYSWDKLVDAIVKVSGL
ncbi:MAG: glycosyltransferase [Bacteroidales bacterium]|nr:glycosyltransferase [Bacteroidales bacterium]